MKKLVLLVLIVFLSFNVLVLAQETYYDYTDQTIYDDNPSIYSDPNSYQSNDFYSNSNPSDWEVSQVDFSNSNIWDNPQAVVLFTEEDLYSNLEFYTYFSNIPPEEYGSIEWGSFDFSNSKFSFNSVIFPVESDDFHSVIANNENGGLDKYRETYLPGQSFNLHSGSEDRLRFGDGTLSSISRTGSRVINQVTFNDFPVEDFPGTVYSTFDNGEIHVTTGGDVVLDSSKISDGTSVEVYVSNAVFNQNDIDNEDAFSVSGNLLIDKTGESSVFSIPPGDTVDISALGSITNTGSDVIPLFGLDNDDFSQELQTLEQQGNFKEIHNKLYGLSNQNDIYSEPAIYIGTSGFVATSGCEGCTPDNIRDEVMRVTVSSDNIYGIPVEIAKAGIFIGTLEYGEQLYNDYLTIKPTDGSFAWNGENAEVYGRVGIENGHREVMVDGAVYSQAVSYEEVSRGSVSFGVEIFDNDGNNPYTSISGMSNEFYFGESQNIDMGEPPVGHFAVRIDPYKIFTGDDAVNSETFQVISNLENSKFHQPYLIISTPESGGLLETYKFSAQIFEDNLDLRYEPMTIQLQGDLDDPEVFLSTHIKLFEEIDRGNNLDHDVPVTIIGHSGFNPGKKEFAAGYGPQIVRYSNIILGEQIHLDNPATFDQETLDKIEELSGVHVTLDQINNLRTDIVEESGIDYSNPSFSEYITIENQISEQLFSGAEEKVNEFNGERLFRFETYELSGEPINPRESAPLGCSEAYQRYNDIKDEVISEALNDGTIEYGENKDYHQEPVSASLVSTSVHIRDSDIIEELKDKMDKQFLDLGELYVGLNTASSGNSLSSQGEMGITGDSIPYHAIMSVMRTNYPSETQNLDERELLQFAIAAGDIGVDCLKLNAIIGGYKDIFC